MTKERGFTLMELMIVVSIILILSSAGFASYIFSVTKSRDARRRSDISTITRALQAFANDFGTYPISNNGKMVACDYSNGSLVSCNWGEEMSAYVNDQAVIYLSVLSTDPDGDREYYYESSSNGSTYSLYAALENEKDPNYRTDISLPCGSGVTCNYQVTESGVK